MQNSSGFWTSSAKSTADQTQAFSLPVCSCSFVPGITAAHSTDLMQGGLHLNPFSTSLACSVSAQLILFVLHCRLMTQLANQPDFGWNSCNIFFFCTIIADALIHGGGERHAGTFQHTKRLIWCVCIGFGRVASWQSRTGILAKLILLHLALRSNKWPNQ